MANRQSTPNPQEIQVIIGQRFSRWVVLNSLPKEPGEHRRVLCRCDCGTVRSVLLYQLRRGATRSCGCYKIELTNKRQSRHNGSKTALYKRWCGIIQRCNNPKNTAYPLYGGRGISVCAKWLDFAVFREWALSCNFDESLSIDRIDSNGDYEPSNCRWTTMTVQRRNQDRNHFVTAFGETRCIADWSEDERCTVTRDTLYERFARGMTPEDAISLPAGAPQRDMTPYRHMRTNHLVTAFGETKCLAAWTDDRRCVVAYGTLQARLIRGWSSEDAISRPSRRQHVPCGVAGLKSGNRQM